MAEDAKQEDYSKAKLSTGPHSCKGGAQYAAQAPEEHDSEGHAAQSKKRHRIKDAV